MLEKILKIGKRYNAIAIKRPKNISGDKAKSEEAVLHVLDNIKYIPDAVVMLEPTAPLREPWDIDMGVESFYKDNLDTGFSGAILEDFLIWKENKRKKLTS